MQMMKQNWKLNTIYMKDNKKFLTNVDKQVIDPKHPTIVRYDQDRKLMDFKYSMKRVMVDGKLTFIPGHTGKHLRSKVSFYPGMRWKDAPLYECVPSESIQRNLDILYQHLDLVFGIVISNNLATEMKLNSTWRPVQAVKNQAENSYHIFGGAADLSFYDERGRRIERDLKHIYNKILEYIKKGHLPQGELFLYNTFIHYAPTNTKSNTSYTNKGELIAGMYSGGTHMNEAFKFILS